MRYIYSFLTLAFLLLQPSFSADAARQSYGSITGSVTDAKGAPIGFATVAVMQRDSSLVTGVACQEDGTYTISGIAAGEYILSASMVGYLTATIDVQVQSTTQEIAPIVLQEDVAMLSGAVLSEKVKLVEMKLDKIVMNVSQSAFAKGSNALELMKKAPGVTIDKDGNVKLNGKDVAVWIDGRPSYADGKTLEALLRSTNGDSVEKFELMEHPSSKYDAEGQGGIINIKTKRTRAAGFNGSLGAGGGGMYFSDTDRFLWQESLWANITMRTKKTNTFVNVYEGIYNMGIGMDNQLGFDTGSGSFQQRALTDFVDSYRNYNVKIGNDWFIDDKNTFGVIVYVPGMLNVMNSISSQTEQWQNDVLWKHTDSDVRNRSEGNHGNVNLNYTHIFDEKKAEELTANLDYYRRGATTVNTQNDVSYMAVDPSTLIPSQKDLNSNSVYDIYSAKADYQRVMWQKVMFEAGMKWATSMTDNNSLEKTTGAADQRSDFYYREHVGAAYFNMSRQFGPKFSAKFGLRGEYTNSHGDWRSAGTQTDRSYFNLFPTAYVGWMPSEKWRLSASYSRRISRPSYSQMDPAKQYIDAQTYTMGNPEITPQFSHDMNLSAGYGQHLSLSAGYNYMKDMLFQIPSYETSGVECLTWGNFGHQHMAYTSFNVSALPVTKWLDWTLSLTGLYTHGLSDELGFDNESFGAQVYTDLTFTLPKSWKIQADCHYASPMSFATMRIMSMLGSNIAVKKDLMDGRMTLSLRLDDVFRSQSQDLEILGVGSAVSRIGQRYDMQKLIFDLTFNFGKAQHTRARRVGNLEEMSRTGSSSGLSTGK